MGKKEQVPARAIFVQGFFVLGVVGGLRSTGYGYGDFLAGVVLPMGD